jgi:hypothetical protein
MNPNNAAGTVIAGRRPAVLDATPASITKGPCKLAKIAWPVSELSPMVEGRL